MTEPNLSKADQTLAKLKPKELDEVWRRYLLGMALESPLALGRYVYGDAWQEPPHVRLICERALNAIETGGKLMIFAPPRHGKSVVMSHLLPTWYALTHQDKRVVLASYGQTYASTWGQRCLETIIDIGPRFKVSVNPRRAGSGDWLLTNGSGMLSTGVGGATTGRGADLFLIDDPIKNAEEALSDRQRDSAWDWYRSVAETRLEPMAAQILMMTRWHEDDLAGRLIANNADGDWEIVSLPALAESDDQLNREPGEALWADRYDETYLEDLRKAGGVGEYWFSSMFQQRPSPPEGVLFTREHSRFYELHGSVAVSPKKDKETISVDVSKGVLFATMDPALIEGQQNDYTALGLWCYAEPYLILAELIRVKQDYTDHEGLVKRFMADHPKCEFIGIEQIPVTKVLMRSLKQAGIPVRKLETHGKSKVARAQTAITMWQQERILLPEKQRNSEEFEELVAFWRAKHDDYADILSYAAIEAHKMSSSGSGWGLTTCPKCQKSMVGSQCGACGAVAA